MNSILRNLFLLTLVFSLSFAIVANNRNTHFREWETEQDPNSFSNTNDVITTHFDLQMDLDFDKHQIVGTQTLYMNALRAGVTEVDLDINQIRILRVTEASTESELEFTVVTPDPNLIGDQLQIFLKEPTTEIGQVLIISIEYISTEPIAASWLNPEQTSSKVLPYMYTQCQAVSCRSVAPFQDTPYVKATFAASVSVPDPMRAYLSGNFTGSTAHATKPNYLMHKFESTIPIASYLFTIVAGNLVEREVGSPRTFVISEPTHIDEYVAELDQIDVFLTTLEDYTIPYAWGSYKIVIMPPSFPMGGMENPLLTFASPSIIVGDKSGVSVAVHEIAHSWSGNLVTCKDWANLWLNEGFTMYLERMADSIMFGEDYSVIDAIVGNDTFVDDLNDFGLTSNFTTLHPILIDANPDDAVTNVPYEKGYQFLKYIEQVIGKEQLQAFLRAYFSKFAFESIGFEVAQKFFVEFVLETFGEKEGNRLNGLINWEQWVFQPGFPPINLNFNTPTIPLIKALAQEYIDLNGDSPEGFEIFETYSLNEKAIFLQYLFDNLKDVNANIVWQLDADFNLSGSTNKEISWRWFRITILVNYLSNIEEVDQFLGSIGRIKMIKPVYQALNDAGYRDIALVLFRKYQNFYHPLAVQAIQRVLGISTN